MSYVVSRIIVKAGQAVSNPQIASVLGPRGIAPPIFCQKANELCNSIPNLDQGILVRLAVTEVDKKRNFKLKFLGVVTTALIKKHCGLEKCSSSPGKSIVSKITIDDLKLLVKKKIDSLNVFDEDHALSMLKGTALSMGIKVVNE